MYIQEYISDREREIINDDFISLIDNKIKILKTIADYEILSYKTIDIIDNQIVVVELEITYMHKDIKLCNYLLINTLTEDISNIYNIIIYADNEIRAIDINGVLFKINKKDLTETKLITRADTISKTYYDKDINISALLNTRLYNIHGELLPYTHEDRYLPVNENTLMSRVDRKILVFNNLMSKKLLKEIDLSALKQKVRYFPIVFNGKSNKGYKNYLFMYFKNTYNLYAYDWYTKEIFKVNTNGRFAPKDNVIEYLRKALDTPAEMRNDVKYRDCIIRDIDEQIRLEKQCFEDDIINDFGLEAVMINNEKHYIIADDVSEIVEHYQYMYNDLRNVQWNRENLYGTYYSGSGDKVVDVKEVLPYSINKKQLLLELKKYANKNSLIVTDQIVSIEELCRIESIRH